MIDIEYICHPVSGEVEENIADIERIMAERHSETNIPFAPYLTALRYLEDSIPEQRALGMAANREFFLAGTITKLYVCGSRISSGMQSEILLAYEQAIPIETTTELEGEAVKILPFHMSYVGQRKINNNEAIIAVMEILNSGDLLAYNTTTPPANREEYNAGKRGIPKTWDECFNLNWSDYRNRENLMDKVASVWGSKSIQSLVS